MMYMISQSLLVTNNLYCIQPMIQMVAIFETSQLLQGQISSCKIHRITIYYTAAATWQFVGLHSLLPRFPTMEGQLQGSASSGS